MSKLHPLFQSICEAHGAPKPVQHHRRCAAFPFGKRPCSRNCTAIQQAIDAFNNDDTQTHRSNPDSREHYHARFPILAEDCDYEISGFSGVQGRRIDQ